MHVSVDGRDAIVRYLGIDSPDGGPGATSAKLANQKLVEGQIVYLEKDVTDADTYGRLLRYVWLADGRLLNQELVRLGCAAVTAKAPDLKYQDRLLRAQGAAQEAKRTCSLQDVQGAHGEHRRAAGPGTDTCTGSNATPTAVLRSAPGSGRGSANTTANLRSGPGTQYDIAGRLAPGDAVQVAGCNDACDWYKLNTGQWVFAELITMDHRTGGGPDCSRHCGADRCACRQCLGQRAGERPGVWGRHGRSAQRPRRAGRERGDRWRTAARLLCAGRGAPAAVGAGEAAGGTDRLVRTRIPVAHVRPAPRRRRWPRASR